MNKTTTRTNLSSRTRDQESKMNRSTQIKTRIFNKFSTVANKSIVQEHRTLDRTKDTLVPVLSRLPACFQIQSKPIQLRILDRRMPSPKAAT